ncbi:uncharacterized protein [Musca autumnalis]|uniref:uncharacterized protein n=1 Tax=Musca autumnalis TaxID=221902 RepID=UPI003CE94AB2
MASVMDEHGKFSVLLNGQRDVEEQLNEFKKACNAHDKHNRKRCKRRYYNLALMARMACNTSCDEIRNLIQNGTRTFLLDAVRNRSDEIEKMASLITQTVEEIQTQDPHNKLVVGVAIEINGDCCRIGRLRNNCSIFVEIGSNMTLTSNSSYRYSGFNEICYVINLQHYLPTLKLGDEIKIGGEVKGRIVKILKTNISILIDEAGIINSYDYIELPEQCKFLNLQKATNVFSHDLEMAAGLQADFLVIPQIRCKTVLKMLRHYIRDNFKFQIIGTIDLEYVSRKMLDIMGIIKLLDFLWLTNLFDIPQALHTYICQDVIPIAKCWKKPLIATVPLKRCSDFRVFENHDFLWKIDCIFMEKSEWCNKYPLIVKKLLPIKNYRRGIVQNISPLRDDLSSYQSAVNFVIRTISTIECQAIFLHTKCQVTAAALGRMEIYCPVFVIISMEDDDGEEEMLHHIQMAKNLNLRRNLNTIIYNRTMNPCEYKPIDYGIEYARYCGAIEMGDFIITIDLDKYGGEDAVQLGVGEDVVIMRAYYVPPKSVGEKLIC